LGYDLPNQLTWEKFCAALTRLEYAQGKSHGGSARNFFRNPGARKDKRLPDLVTFHEPHGSGTIRPGTLSSYIKKLGLEHNEFLDILNGVVSEETTAESEELFRHTTSPDGRTISNCLRCLVPVADSKDEEEVKALELAHRCPELATA
jgi:hypothetical protein